MMTLFRSFSEDDTVGISMVLLFKRNSIPPVAVAVGEAVDLLCSLEVVKEWSSDFGRTRGVMVVSVRTIGIGKEIEEELSVGSSLTMEES